jgi:hypothetical protein
MEVELLNARFVGGDGGAFDGNPDLFGRLRSLDGDLVARLVALLNAEVEIHQVNVEIRIDQFFLDQLPNDPGHLVAIHLDDRIGYFDFCHVGTTFVQEFCGAQWR